LIVYNLITFLLAVIVTEALTEIIVKSEFFSPLRAKIYKLGKENKFFDWLHQLLDCGYCFSVWAGALIAVLLFRDVGLIHKSIDWFLVGLVLHRLSNLFHNIMDKIHGIDDI